MPGSATAGEDEGWLMGYVFDPARGASDLVILDAHDFAAEPVATVHLPARVPQGFHGNWIPTPPSTAERHPTSTTATTPPIGVLSRPMAC